MKNAAHHALFSPSAIILLIACAVTLFALSILLKAYDHSPRSTGEKVRPSSYARSAIGHAAFYDLLRRTGFSVSRGLDNVLGMVGSQGTLIMAEPSSWRISEEDSLKAITAPKLLLVLPKWQGEADKRRPAWLAAMSPLDVSSARAPLALVTGSGELVRKDWPQSWTINLLGISPAQGTAASGAAKKTNPAEKTKPSAKTDVETDTGTGKIQLIRSKALRPLVADADGILLGELIDRKGQRSASGKVWVLADPDVLSNHGMGKGDNAGFMLALMDAMQDGKRQEFPIVFDETIHGFRASEETPLSLLFRFPFVVVTALICATAFLLAFAVAGRFGAALRPRPELDFGKARLIDNSARLLDYAGLHAEVLQRYLRMIVRSVARSLHAPPALDEAALAAWLDRIGKARGVQDSCTGILNTVAALAPDDPHYLARLFENAVNIHRWKGEMLHGSANDQRHRQ